MKDISSYVSRNVKDNNDFMEFIWDEVRHKVVLFKNNDPIAYVDLGDDNTLDNALKAASVLLNNGGTSLVSVR